MDVFVAQPEVPADAAEALPVLLPVPVEGDEATLSSLNDGPAASCRLHVTEHLGQRCSGQGPAGAGAGAWEWTSQPVSLSCRASGRARFHIPTGSLRTLLPQCGGEEAPISLLPQRVAALGHGKRFQLVRWWL